MNQELKIKNKKITLLIDTSSNEEISVGLEINGKEDFIKEKVGREKAQVVLPLISNLLNKNSLDITDITSVTVNKGPGSFTGVRVGVSIANMLSFSLNVPINGEKTGTIIEPVYE